MKKKNKKPIINVKGILMSKGFYITLATLIIVFGTAAVVKKLTNGMFSNNSSFDETAWTDAVESVKSENNENDENNEEYMERSLEEIYYEPEEIEEIPQITEPTAYVNKEMSFDEILAKLNLGLPIDGKIIRGHSPDKHVYYEKMNDWRTHNGVDIKAEEGTIVTASAEGVVEKVYEDKKLGIVVEIGHEGGIKTRYANLSDLSYIEVGRKVAKGDSIGSVGKSSPVEGGEKSHIHFEILKDDVSQNPSEYIKM